MIKGNESDGGIVILSWRLKRGNKSYTCCYANSVSCLKTYEPDAWFWCGTLGQDGSFFNGHFECLDGNVLSDIFGIWGFFLFFVLFCFLVYYQICRLSQVGTESWEVPIYILITKIACKLEIPFCLPQNL